MVISEKTGSTLLSIVAMEIGNWQIHSRSRSMRVGRSYSQKESNSESEPKWIRFWKKITKKIDTKRKNKKRTCFVYSYDENEYMQNFDEGSEMGNTDLLCRSFSARYANPIRKDMMV